MRSNNKGIIRSLFFVFIAALMVTGFVVLLNMVISRIGKLRSNAYPQNLPSAMQDKNARISIGNIPEYDSREYRYDVPRGIDIAAGSYADGVYEGSADGYSEGLVVQVMIADGIVQSIEVSGNNETPGFYEYVFEEYAGTVVEEQSTELDTVSGATYTSNAYLAAVEDALEKAAAD